MAAAEAAGHEPPHADPSHLAHRWAEELDRHSIAASVLIASVPSDEGSVLAAAAAHPNRFYPWAMFNPTAPDAEARTASALQNGIRCLCLFPSMHVYSMTDTRVRSVVQAAAAHGHTAIFVHCGVLSVGVRRKLGLPSRFDLRFGNPVDLHGLAVEFPSVPFIIPHFGAGFFREALMVADLCPNVYLDTSSSNGWARYITPEPSLREVFRRALDVLGPQRLLFGSDSSNFPRGWVHSVFDEQSKVLYELAVPEADVRAILGGNLATLMSR